MTPGEEQSLRQWLRGQSVQHNVRNLRRLYAWVSVPAVRNYTSLQNFLSSPNASTSGQPLFQKDLLDLSGRDRLAKWAFQRSRSRHQRAWPNVWGASMRPQGGSFGSQLLAIDLRPDTLIMVVERGGVGPAVRFMDTRGRSVPRAYARQNSHRLGVLLRIARPYEPPKREYVVFNPDVIGRVSSNTSELQRLLAYSHQQLGVLQRVIAHSRLPATNRRLFSVRPPGPKIPLLHGLTP